MTDTHQDLLIQQLASNRFVDKLRIQSQFDAAELRALIETLEAAECSAIEWEAIRKELAMLLYTIPQMIQNALFAAQKSGCEVRAAEIEAAWVDVDRLVLNILTAE